MPFKSQAQRRFLFARKPKVAREFASKTKNIKALPEKVVRGALSKVRKRRKK